MNRRSFLMTPGLLSAREAMSWQGANDRVNLAVVGVRGRGRDHITGFVQSPNTRITAVCDIDQANVERAQAHTQKLSGGQPRRLLRLPQAARRQVHPRRLARHAQPLARPRRRLGDSGGQGRLRRKARLAQPPRRPRARGSRPQVQAHRPGGTPVPLHPPQDRGHAPAARGRHRPRLSRQGLLLQAPPLHRPFARRPRAAGVDYDPGSAPRPCALSTPTASTTTGTGSGTTATATSATRASTKWISAAGA
jgi:hypothetical protein